jgi:hypothetical protein
VLAAPSKLFGAEFDAIASLAVSVNVLVIAKKTKQEIFIATPLPPGGGGLGGFRRPGKSFAVQARREAA